MNKYPILALAVLGGALLAKPLELAYTNLAEAYIAHQAEQPGSFPAQAVLDAHHNSLIPQQSIDHYLAHFTDEVNTQLHRRGLPTRIPSDFYVSQMQEIDPSFRVSH